MGTLQTVEVLAINSSCVWVIYDYRVTIGHSSHAQRHCFKTRHCQQILGIISTFYIHKYCRRSIFMVYVQCKIELHSGWFYLFRLLTLLWGRISSHISHWVIVCVGDWCGYDPDMSDICCSSPLEAP